MTHDRQRSQTALFFLIVTSVFSIWHVVPNGPAHVQAQTPPISSSGLNTQVSTPINPPNNVTQYNITGGTRPDNGPNLFHSFGEFGVPTNNIANFLNETALPTSNILGRVNGGDISNIFGTIQTTGFGNANLFLMNPSGFLFGPNATVNVGGMMTFTSADYMKLADGGRFNANPNAIPTDILTTVPIAAFGFLGSNAGAITLQGSQFSVTEGSGISLVGGNITVQSGVLDNEISIQPARLTAPGGQIKLASGSSPGEILSSNLQIGANVNGESFTSLGSITISQDTYIDTAGGTSGTITIRGGQLTISDGATIASAPSSSSSVPAGSVIINGTGVQMTGSDMVINGTNVSVTGSKVTAANLDDSGGTIAISAGSADHPGNVTVAQNALLDASGTKGGSISIRGKQLEVDKATISADTVIAGGAPIAIDINVTGDLSISTVDVPALTARTTGAGDAAEIRVSSGNMGVNATAVESVLYSVIDTHTSGPGKAGNVRIVTGDLTVIGEPVNGFTFFVDSGTTGLDGGHGDDVAITARIIQAQDTAISTGNFLALNLGEESTGSSGNLSINADRLHFTNVNLVTDAFSFTSTTGESGNIAITAHDINLDFSLLSSLSQERGATIAIGTDRLVANNSQILTETGPKPGGGIAVNGRIIELTNGSSLTSSTAGDGHAGPIFVTATDHLGLLRSSTNDRPSGIFSNSLGTFGSLGNSGDIVITTPLLEMTGGARINTSTATSGRGGNVIINAPDSISMLGETGGQFPEPLFSLGTIRPSGIFTSSIGGKCAGPCGNAGNVAITTGSLIMGTGSQINSGTSSNGRGGNIAITATDTIFMSGTLSTGQPGGIQSRTIGTDPDAGAGGNIALIAGQSVTLSNGAGISASSTGLGNTGNIDINAAQSFVATNSSVTTQAKQASGGAIKITTTPSGTVQLTNSAISASVLDGTGGGGSVNIDPQVVILQNSQISAKAVRGAGGNISITTNLLLPDATSEISASSQFGVNGTVTIQSPNSPASGKIQPLRNQPLDATSLLNQRCAALAGGEFSSFTVAGRDILPAEPGSWLASPLATLSAGTGLGVKGEGARSVARGEGLEGMTVHDPLADERTLLSLRQIAPSGFLTQAFAVDWSAGCQS